jgi:hypothetical protein
VFALLLNLFSSTCGHAVMKLIKSIKLNPEALLIYALRLCTKLLAKDLDLRLS